MPLADPRVEVDAPLVRRLLSEQLPQWADLPLEPVELQGNDNRTFRLGDDLTVRLPSHARYAAGVAKEDAALPLLARHLSTRIPEVVATGRPSEAFGMPFSVRRWLPGTPLDATAVVDDERLAAEVGAFVRELRCAPTEGGPAGGQHSFFRGCHPSAYGREVQLALEQLGSEVDAAACERVWARAMTLVWQRPPVWFHGDVAPGNLLVGDAGGPGARGDGGAALAAVIDFGTCGVGDPACDLVLAWTRFDRDARRVFREEVQVDDATWARGRAWALWKALITLAGPHRHHGHHGHHAHHGQQQAAQHEVVDRVLSGS